LFCARLNGPHASAEEMSLRQLSRLHFTVVHITHESQQLMAVDNDPVDLLANQQEGRFSILELALLSSAARQALTTTINTVITLERCSTEAFAAQHLAI
jgi:hypothetical protein